MNSSDWLRAYVSLEQVSKIFTPREISGSRVLSALILKIRKKLIVIIIKIVD